MIKERKSDLHVRESNPGRLRDRQKCYQLHQHGYVICQKTQYVSHTSNTHFEGARRTKQTQVSSLDHTTMAITHPI